MGVGLVWRCQGQNRPNLAEFPSVSNFARAIASPGVEHDPQKVLQLTALEKLVSFVSYEFSLFNTWENRKSQTTRDFRVPSIGALSKNQVFTIGQVLTRPKFNQNGGWLGLEAPGPERAKPGRVPFFLLLCPCHNLTRGTI